MKSESEVAQSCPTLHDPMDCSLPGSSVHGIFQARVLEWGAIAFFVVLCSDPKSLIIRGLSLGNTLNVLRKNISAPCHGQQLSLGESGEDLDFFLLKQSCPLFREHTLWHTDTRGILLPLRVA